MTIAILIYSEEQWTALRKTKDTHAWALSLINASFVTDLTLSLGRLFDRHPREVKVILSVIARKLKGYRIPQKEVQRNLFLARKFQELYSEIIRSEKSKRAVKTILRDYSILPSTPATRLKTSSKEHSVGGAALVGFALGTLIVGAIILVLAASAMAEEEEEGEEEGEGEEEPPKE